MRKTEYALLMHIERKKTIQFYDEARDFLRHARNFR
jgi:hypothetical protein